MANRLETINTFRETFGFDYFRVYCSVTGKPFAFLNSEERTSILSLVCESNDDADEAANDLWTRMVASMRPSLKWNKFRSESLAQMRQTNPVETLAYLINRMFAPHNRLKGGVTLVHLEERIKAWQHIESWGVTDETNTLMYMLLELDAKMNLDSEMPPFNWRDFFAADSMQTRVTFVQGWYAELMVKWEKRIKQDEMQTRWIRHGNVLAKPAFRDAFMESQPLSATAIKKQAKSEEKQMFGDLLFEILSPIMTPQMEPKPDAPKPAIVPLARVVNPFARS
jgi:hypothetical protein